MSKLGPSDTGGGRWWGGGGRAEDLTHLLPPQRRWLAALQTGPPGRTEASVCPDGRKKGSDLVRGRSQRKQPGGGGGDFFLFASVYEPSQQCRCNNLLPCRRKHTRCSSDLRFCNIVMFSARLQPGPPVRRLIINSRTLAVDRPHAESAAKGH